MEVLRWSENQRAELLELIEAEVAIWETQRSPAQAAWAKKRVGDQIGVARDFVTLQHHLN